MAYIIFSIFFLFPFFVLSIHIPYIKMASNILRRTFATSVANTVKIGLIPADGIGREGSTIFDQAHGQ
jgi:hypothetical protein